MAKNKEKLEGREIEFLISPTGAFNLGYNAGDTAVLGNKELEDELTKLGYARYTDDAANAASENVDLKKLQDENTQLKKAVEGYVTEIDNLKIVVSEKENSIAELKSSTVKTNDTAKEAAAANVKAHSGNADNTSDKGAATAEKASTEK